MNSRLVHIRKNVLKITQQEFADRIGMNRAALSQYERGHTPIPKYISKLISKVFEINENWLLNGEGSLFISEKENYPNIVLESNIKYNDRILLREIIEMLISNPEIEEHVYYYIKVLITKPQEKQTP